MDLALALADIGVVPVGDHGLIGVRAAATDVEHPPVGGGDQPVRLADLVGLARLVGPGDAFRLVVGVDGGLAVGPHQPGRPQQRATQMVAEVGFAVGVRGAAHPGVEGTPAVVVAAPGDRVVPAVGARARLVRDLPHPGHGVDGAGRIGLPVQPGVGPLPLQRKVLGGRMHPVADLDRGALDGGRAAVGGPGADQSGEPVRVRLGARRVVDAEEPASRLHVRLQTRLLLRVEDVAAAGQEDHRVVGAELLGGGEDGGVVGGHGLEPLVRRAALPDLLDGRDPGVHRRRLRGRRAVEDQHLDVAAAGWRRQGQRCPRAGPCLRSVGRWNRPGRRRGSAE